MPVNRILLVSDKTESLLATGATATLEVKSYNVKALKEVIVALGAFQSPKLLELSGFGDGAVLKSLDMPVLINISNVGENLQDHLVIAISYKVHDGTLTAKLIMRQEPGAIQAAVKQYTESKAGPLSYGASGSHSFILVT